MRFKVPFLRYTLAVFAFLLPTAVLAAVLPFLINTQPIRAKLLREIGSWTGAEVKIAGAISVQDFFSLSVEAQNVEIGQLKAISAVEGMKADRVVARIAWTDLLLGNFQLDKIKIFGAVLKVRADGVQDLPELYAKLITGEATKSFAALHLSDCTIALRTAPRRAYRRLVVDGAVARSGRAGSRLVTKAQLRWKDKKVLLSVNSGFHVEPSARVSLWAQFTSDVVTGRFDGDAVFGETFAAAGEISLQTPDLAKAAAWLGLDVADTLGAPLLASGQFTHSEDTTALTQGEISLAGQTAQAALTLKRKEEGPHLEGTLAFEQLDLKALLTAAGMGREGLAVSLGNLVDADLRASAKAMTWDGVSAGDTALALALRSQRLTAEIAELDFLGGEVRGQIALDVAGPMTHASARLSVEGMDSTAFLSLARQRDWLSGPADVNLEAEVAWADPAEIVEKLEARARVNFPDGGQMRLDIPRLAASALEEGNGWGTFEFANAPFEKLRFALALREGQLGFTDVVQALAGRRVSGQGEIDLATRSLDWRFTFAPGAAPQAEGGATAGGGIARSVISRLSIKGPWTSPVIRSGEGADNSALPSSPRAPRAAALEISPSGR